jgi:small-conductance mechanosensitive channel
MAPTPLQDVLQLDLLNRQFGDFVEGLLMAFGLLAAFAVRRRHRVITATTFLLLGVSLLIDAASRLIPVAATGRKVAVAAFVLFLFGVIRLIIEVVDAATRRGKPHSNSILKELVMFAGWLVVLMIVAYTDFGFQPLSLLTATTVLGAVLGFALQETLGNIFSGLTLQMGHPFDPGDWVRSGPHVGQVKGIAWRATTIMTRANERLEIPNSMMAKDVLFNYATGGVRDEISVGISYGVAPNHVREVVLKLLRDVPQVMRDPAPEVYAWEYGESSINYRIKYWILDYGAQEHVRDRVVSSLWYALRRHSIEIPFPIRTVHMRDARADESKADSGMERELMNAFRSVPFLSRLSDDELKTLVPTVAVRKFGAGELLVRDGEDGDSMFIFRSGTAEVFGHGADGTPRHIANYHPGDFTGEMALMTGEPRSASVRAVTDIEVIEMDREGLRRLFKEHPEAVAAIGDIIAARNKEKLEKLSAGDSQNGKRGVHLWLFAKMRELFDLQ